MIFTQFFSNLQYIGILGNANLNYQDDWLQPLNENTDGLLNANTDFVWDDETKTCTHIAGLELQIMYSKLGYVEKP